MPSGCRRSPTGPALTALLLAVALAGPALAADVASVRLISVGLGGNGPGYADLPLFFRVEVTSAAERVDAIIVSGGLPGRYWAHCELRQELSLPAGRSETLELLLPCGVLSGQGLDWSLEDRDGRQLSAGSLSITRERGLEWDASIHFTDGPGEENASPLRAVPESVSGLVAYARVRLAAADFDGLAPLQRLALLDSVSAGALLVLTGPGGSSLPEELRERLADDRCVVQSAGAPDEIREQRQGLGLVRRMSAAEPDPLLSRLLLPLRPAPGSAPVLPALFRPDRDNGLDPREPALATSMTATLIEWRHRRTQGALAGAASAVLAVVALLAACRRAAPGEGRRLAISAGVLGLVLLASVAWRSSADPGALTMWTHHVDERGRSTGAWVQGIAPSGTRSLRIVPPDANRVLLLDASGPLERDADGWEVHPRADLPASLGAAHLTAWVASDEGRAVVSGQAWPDGQDLEGRLEVLADCSDAALLVPDWWNERAQLTRTYELGRLRTGQVVDLSRLSRSEPRAWRLPRPVLWSDNSELRRSPVCPRPMLLASLEARPGDEGQRRVVQELPVPEELGQIVGWSHAGARVVRDRESARLLAAAPVSEAVAGGELVGFRRGRFERFTGRASSEPGGQGAGVLLEPVSWNSNGYTRRYLAQRENSSADYLVTWSESRRDEP